MIASVFAVHQAGSRRDASCHWYSFWPHCIYPLAPLVYQPISLWDVSKRIKIHKTFISVTFDFPHTPLISINKCLVKDPNPIWSLMTALFIIVKRNLQGAESFLKRSCVNAVFSGQVKTFRCHCQQTVNLFFFICVFTVFPPLPVVVFVKCTSQVTERKSKQDLL